MMNWKLNFRQPDFNILTFGAKRGTFEAKSNIEAMPLWILK